MSRVLIFDGLKANEHTHYEDADTGATVQVYPGSQIPARVIVDPEHYVAHGYARLEGEEDGTDGRLDRLMAGMRALLTEIAPLQGPVRNWTLNGMVAQARTIQADDIASRAAFAASESAAAEADAAAAAEEAAAAQATSDAAAASAQEAADRAAAEGSIDDTTAQGEAGGGTSEVAPV